MWTVILLRKPQPYTYPPDYFPRRFRYKADALLLMRQIEQRGGLAQVIKGL